MGSVLVKMHVREANSGELTKHSDFFSPGRHVMSLTAVIRCFELDVGNNPEAS